MVGGAPDTVIVGTAAPAEHAAAELAASELSSPLPHPDSKAKMLAQISNAAGNPKLLITNIPD